MPDEAPPLQAVIPAQVEADLRDAMRAGDVARRDALRLLRNAIKNAEIDRRGVSQASLTDAEIRAVIQRQIKQRRDSIEQFRNGHRDDLAAKEETEIAVFQRYLPAMMSEAELRAAAESVVAATGATGPKEMGKVMPVLLARVGDRAERGAVAAVVRELLSR